MDSTWAFVTMLTGLSSLGVALIAWLQASRLAKQNANSNLELEMSKAENIAALEKLRTDLTANANLDLEKLRADNAQVMEKLKTENARLLEGYKAGVMADLEKGKAESEKRLKAYETACQEVLQGEAAINACWQRIQRVKDLMRWLSTATPGPESGLMIRELEEAIRDFDRGYSLIGVELPNGARRIVHRARHPVRHWLYYVHRIQKGEVPSKPETDEIPTALKRLCDELTQSQTALMEIRDNLRPERMNEILAAWNDTAVPVPNNGQENPNDASTTPAA